MRPGVWLGLALLAVVSGSSGCSTYKYFDIHASFAAGGSDFDRVSAFRIMRCRVDVSGADQASFALFPEGHCPNKTGTGDALDAGVFEYSSFADSGTMVFTLKAFEDTNENPDCQVGEGVASVPITGDVTIKHDLVVTRGGRAGCAAP